MICLWTTLKRVLTMQNKSKYLIVNSYTIFILFFIFFLILLKNCNFETLSFFKNLQNLMESHLFQNFIFQKLRNKRKRVAINYKLKRKMFWSPPIIFIKIITQHEQFSTNKPGILRRGGKMVLVKVGGGGG